MSKKQSDIGLEDVQAFFAMLMGGELPDGMALVEQPQLSAKAAFGVIYYLQEHLRIIPDTFEMCAECENLMSSDEGWTVDADGWYDHEEIYMKMGLTREIMAEYEGMHLCSLHCEDNLWRTVCREKRLSDERTKIV